MDVMVAYIIHYYQATLMESLFVIDYCYELERIEILLFQVVNKQISNGMTLHSGRKNDICCRNDGCCQAG